MAASECDWLRQLLIGVQLESFLPKIRDELHITRPNQLESIHEDDLVRVGLSRPAAKRLMAAAFAQKLTISSCNLGSNTTDSKKISDSTSPPQMNLLAKDANHQPLAKKQSNEMHSKSTAVVSHPTSSSLSSASGVKLSSPLGAIPKSQDSTGFNPTSDLLPCTVSSCGLSVDKLIGTGGTLGNVHRADWTVPLTGQKIVVAVRMLASSLLMSSGSPPKSASCQTGAQLTAEVAKELNAMAKLSHGNVLTMYGIVTSTPTIMLLFEYADNGSLKSLLHAPSASHSVVTVTTLLEYVIQVAHGMSYLESQAFVHGNLAACNIMITANQQVKIGDYGLTHLLHGAHSQSRNPRCAWYAPEALVEPCQWSSAGDVWMFGVVLWEVFSGGAEPWIGNTAAQIVRRLNNAERLVRPAHCPERIHLLMCRCWNMSPRDRPHFPQIISMLNEVPMPEIMAHGDLDEPGKLSIRNGDTIIVTRGGSDCVLWEGQNARTGAKGEFPKAIVLPNPPIPKNLKSEINVGNDMMDGSVLSAFNDNHVQTHASSILKSSAKPSVIPPGWTTFESTTDLAADKTSGKIVGEKHPNTTTTLEITPSAKPALTLGKPATNGGGYKGAREKYAAIAAGNASGSDVEIAVSDTTCLLPAASVTSVSEPCSPAHGATARAPDLLSVDNACFDDGDGDPQRLCISLPASRFSERLSWMTSSSCENLNSTAARTNAGNGLCAPSHFGEHLSKASSDSPVYVGGGASLAPPVPPRDYPQGAGSTRIHRHPTIPGGNRSSLKHSEIHPILQDGCRRSSTHYWLLPEKQRFDATLTPPTPYSADVDRMPYVNVPDGESVVRRLGPVPSVDSDAEVVADIGNLQIETAETISSMGEVSEKVNRVCALVGPDVSRDESYTALAAHQWCVDDAVQYLKIEHLFRLGIASRAVCRAALDAHRWDLEPAASALVDRLQSMPQRSS